MFCIAIGWLTPHIRSMLPVTVGKLYGVSLVPYLWMFIMSSFVAEYRDTVLPFLKRYWWFFLLLRLIGRYLLQVDIMMGMYLFFDTVLLFCAIVGFAYALPKINIKTDISYGVYIYHMTVVNALIALGLTGRSWVLWFVIGMTCLLAWISTKTVGKLSVRKKQILVK